MNARVFLLVTEGESDECVADALNECVGARFTGIAAHGDVTVMSVGTHGMAWASAKDTMGTIRGIIRGEAQRTHEFALRDVVGVAQLTDLDGAYIPDRLVKEGDMRLRYSDACIETCDVQGIIARNRRKRHVMDLMSGWRSIRLTGGREVPYRLFYCSRNLEHALHGLPGDVGVDDKRILSTRVSAHAMRDPAWFHDLVGSPDVSHGVSGFADSWEWARTGVNSLARGSNIVLLPGEFGLKWLA